MSKDNRRDTYLVIGGNGFLGRHIVQQLRDRGDIVSVLDIAERYNDVPFYSGDISEQASVASALRHVCVSYFLLFYCFNFFTEWNYLYNTYCFTARDSEQSCVIPQGECGRD
jgi:nucleoside-diphosphate-sugar epimerase